MKNLKNITFTLLLSVFALTLANAQCTSDTNFRKPVSETLQKIGSIFNVTIIDDRGLLKGKELDYADWRIEPGNLAVSLTNILAPFELMYFKQPDGSYQIRKYENHKVSVDKGKERLNYLTTLYSNTTQWEARKKEIKACMITSFGLDKAPPMPKSKPILTPKRIYKDYSVENIALEILPGVYTNRIDLQTVSVKQKIANYL